MLVARITERARGVFLWVFLVTRLLRVGVSNNDRLTDLLRRLVSFPSDLEAFFKHMLQSVDPFYAPKMSTTLQIALNAKVPLSLSIYSFHEDEFEDAEYSLNLAVRPLERDTVQVAQRINGWCNGLLEVQGGTVHFIHRTVIDFFRTREITDFLAQKAPPNFCATLSLLKAHHVWFKSSPQYRDRELQDTLEYACWHLDPSQAMDRTEEAFAILDDIEPCLREMQQQRRADFGGTAQHYFRYKLVTVGVIPYLSKRIPQEPEYFHGFDSSPLSTLLDSEVEDLWGPEEHQQRQRRQLSTIKCLLKNGEDPNAVGTISRTPWITLLWRTYEWPGGQSFARIEPTDALLQFLEGNLFSLFLQHGADPNVGVTCCGEGSTALFSTAWGLFLTLGANLWASNQSIQARYLEELDAFLIHGADMEGLISGHDFSGDYFQKHKTSVREAFNSACHYPVAPTTQHKRFEQFLEQVRKRLSSVAEVEDSEGISDWQLVIMPRNKIPRFRKLV